MGSLLVITGPPGAGKSTVSQLIASRASTSVLVEGDAFFGFLAGGAIAPWLPESAAQNEVVMTASARSVGAYVEGGYLTVFDGVLGPWFLPVFMGAAGLTALDYVVLLPDVEKCVERVRERVNHGFRDESATRAMHAEFARAQVPDCHVIDPRGAPHGIAEMVEAARAAGEFRWRADA